jgi:hypothetical protein
VKKQPLITLAARGAPVAGHVRLCVRGQTL